MSGTKFIRDRRFFEDDYQSRIAEVPVRDAPPLEDRQPRHLGRRITRYDAYAKASGDACYAFDRQLKHALAARILRCPHPHARLRSLDTGAAERLPGVRAVLHAGNVPEIPWYGDSFLFDRHLRYQGDEVAVVAADSAAVADAALDLIRAEYELLPHETRTMAAFADDAPQYHEEGRLVGGRVTEMARGDVDAALAAADAVVEMEFTTEVDLHNPLEPHNSVCVWEGDRLKVFDSTQGVFAVRDELAEKLGVPAASVEVEAPAIGGGFGSKLELGKHTVMAALLARATGRPVRLALDRREMNLAVGNRPDSVQRIKAAGTRDGKLTALVNDTYGTVGAYAGNSWVSWPLLIMYDCPNASVTHRSIYTNLGRSRPFRAPGFPQGFFALDGVLDELAATLDIDPMEFRIRNFADHNQMSNRPYTSNELLECYRRGAEAIGWSTRRNQVPGAGRGPVKRGIGLASQVWGGAGGPPGGVTVIVGRDGSVNVRSGTQDIGTGTHTFLQQVVAEGLGIELDRVEVTVGVTSGAPYGPLSGGSQTAPTMAPAAWAATREIRDALIAGVAAATDADPAELSYADGAVRRGDESWPLVEALRLMNEQTLVRTGLRAENPEGKSILSFGVQFAEVEVDTATGRIRVLKIVAAHDIGRPLNRTLLENQFEGGIMQGIGMALMEERTVDHATGRVASTNLLDYRLPTVADVPEIEVIIPENIDTEANNLGVKGIGEPAIIPTAAAIANAVHNATGVRMKELPLTPDRVLAALIAAEEVSR
jgi:xanthine dehydrogenase YagR molybdenum-binding subunit